MLKIILGIAMGILLAGFIATAGSIWISGSLISSIGDAIQQKQQVSATQLYNPALQNVDRKSDVVLSKQTQETTQPNGLLSKNLGIANIPKSREEIIRENSEIAVIQARNETQSFDAQYKKPAECYNMKDSATRIKCANAYMTARAAFEKAQK